MMKRIMLGAALAVLIASPALAQSYAASAFGTGNIFDEPMVAKTNGAYGFGGGPQPPQAAKAQSAPARSGLNAFAFVPEQGKVPKHSKASHHPR